MDIRNICLLGHGGSGKTSLVESMLYITGATDRLGKTADGNTVCDYDPEETKRQISISLAMAPVMYQGVKINVLDTPGNFDFAGEMQSGVRAAEVGVLVCASKDGLSVGAERCWKYLREQKKPCIVYISKEDEENANFSTTLEALRENLSKSIAPVVAPIWDENKRTIGIIDVLNQKAYKMGGDKKGTRVEIPIPESKQKVVQELYDQLMEAVAETTEENMEKFFAGEPFTKEEIMTGLKVGMHEGTLAPVVCGSAFTGLGTEMLLQTIVDLVPGPLEVPAEEAADESGENAVEVAHDPNGPTAAIVFKTISDQYGKYSLVKVVSGKITGDMSLYNPTTGKTEKLGRLYTLRGKKTEEVKEMRDTGYNPYRLYSRDPALHRVLDQISNGFSDGVRYDDLVERLLFGSGSPADEYMLLADFASYCAAERRMVETYADRETWNRMSLHNIARSGIFAADRSIADYADTIWHVPYKK